MKSLTTYIIESKNNDFIEAPHYVVAIDKSMSGWGRAEGTNSKVIVACWTLNQANECEKAMGYDKDLKNIRYERADKIKNIRGDVLYYDFETANRWNSDWMFHYGKSGETNGYKKGMKLKFKG